MRVARSYKSQTDHFPDICQNVRGLVVLEDGQSLDVFKN